MSGQTVLGVAVVIATICGPVLAVIVTRFIDFSRLKYQRRMDVFRSLMRTRRLRLSPDHVGALNLVEVDFFDKPPIVAAWQQYHAHLHRVLRKDMASAELDAHFREQDKLLTKLLVAMARVMKIKIEQFEIFDGGYTPQGWEEEYHQQNRLRWLLIDMLNGNRAIPVTSLTTPQPNSPYPPAPNINPPLPGPPSGHQ